MDGDDYVQAEDFDGLKNTNSGTIAFWMRPTGGNYVFWADGLALIERQELSFACVGIWKVTGATPMLRSPTHCLMVSGVTGFSASTMG